MPDRLEDIGSALAERRLDDAARASHSLRGSAGAFGAKRLSTLGMRLEEAVRRRRRRGLLAGMRAEFLEFRDILDAGLAKVGRSPR